MASTSLNSIEHSRLCVIRKGDYLGKYGRQGSMKPRFFLLSKDGQRLEFKGRGQHRIPFKCIMLVAPGRESANFKSKDGDLHRTDPAKFRALSSLSFSVHYYDVDGFSRSLDLQCIGNNEHKTTAEEQYSVWFNGLSMLVHVVRTYEHIPQAVLSQDIILAPSPLSGMNGGNSVTSAGSATHTSGGMNLPSPNQTHEQQVGLHAIINPPPFDVDDSASTESQCHTTHSTEAEAAQRHTQQAFTPGSSAASDSFAYGRRTSTPFSMPGPWPGAPGPAGPAAPPKNTTNTQDSIVSQPETHVVYCCGYDALGGAGAQPSGVLTRLEAFAHVDAQQVVISQRSVACIDGAGQMYMAGTTADGEHFPTAQKLTCLNNQKIVQAACAHSAVFALAETGRVLSWGRCASGLLGMTSRVAVFSPKTLKFLTSGPSPREVAVRFLAAGVHHCAAISDGNLLFTWGDGAYGRLGHGNMDSCFEPRVVSSLQQRRVSTVSCGAYHTAAVCVDTKSRGDAEGSQHRISASRIGGVLYTWGGAFDIQTTMGGGASSNEGCLGLPMLQRHEGVVKPHPVELPNVVDVACGMNFTAAVDVGGAVYQMGSMLRQGEVPGCPWEGAPEPTRVKGELVDAYVTHLSAGTSHVIAAARSLRDSHSGDKPPSLVFTWGANDKGQLARSIQVPAQQRAGSSLPVSQLEQILCLTPDQVVDMRKLPVSGIIGSADSTAVVAAVPKLQHALNAASPGLLAARDSGPLSPGSTKLATSNPAMKILRSVRTSASNLAKYAKENFEMSPPTQGVHAHSASPPSAAGMVLLDSTMPGSTWVNPLLAPPPNGDALRADGPIVMHVGGAIAAADVPGGMPPLSRPISGIEVPALHVQHMPITLPPPPPDFEHVRPGGPDPTSSLPRQSSREQEAPPPAMAYASTAEMMRRLNRGGPMRGIGAVPAPPRTDEKTAAINDRIAWLERVINDRNMEVSLAGAPEPDDADTPTGDKAGAYPSGFDEVQHRNHAELRDLRNQIQRHNQQAANEHLLERVHSSHSSGQHPTDRNVQEWKAEMVAHAHQIALMHPEAEQATNLSDDDSRKKSPGSQETMPLYISSGPQRGGMHDDDDSRMSGPAADGFAADASTGDVDGRFSDKRMLRATDEDFEGDSTPGGDFAEDGEAELDDLEQRHLMLQQAGLPSISEQPDRNESDTSDNVTGNLPHIQDHDSRVGVAPPASTQAASHTAGTAGTDILSTASLPGCLTFLNAGTPQQAQGSVTVAPPTNPHYHLTSNFAATSHTVPASGAPRSITSDPFSNVWQQLQQGPPSVQLLSLSSSVALGPAGGAPASTGANARIHDNTSQMADLRLEIERLRKELSEERAAHKALQQRTLELRTRLSQSTYEPPNKQNPGDMDSTDVAERFKSLVERNPVIVDSFWVPVDDGVSARLDVAEYTGLGKLKFSSRLFDNRAVKEWYKKNKHRVEVGSLVNGLDGVKMSMSMGPSAATILGSYPEGTSHRATSSFPDVARISDPSERRVSDQSSA